MRTDIKRRFAIMATVTALAGAAVLGLWLFSVYDRAVDVSPSPISGGLAESEEDHGSTKVDWEYWLSVNPDIVAWVSVPGTDIDYPVVQASADDPTFYLDHDVYRGWNPYGCPYVDAACDGVGGMSAVVFGHNMGGGFVAMFADFARYSDEAFARSHPTIELQTPNGAMALSVSAVDVIDGSENAKRTDFSSADEMRAWYAQRFEECDVRISNDENASQLFTFVTCSYTTYANERTLVYAQPAES